MKINLKALTPTNIDSFCQSLVMTWRPREGYIYTLLDKFIFATLFIQSLFIQFGLSKPEQLFRKLFWFRTSVNPNKKKDAGTNFSLSY